MVDVTNRPDIHVRLTALEFLLGHFPSPSSPAEADRNLTATQPAH
jgi:hypothetical protein